MFLHSLHIHIKNGLFMEKTLFHKKKLPVFLLLPALGMITALLFCSGRDTRRFDALTDEIFQKELSGNTLNLHYTLAYPGDYGITEEAATLPVYTPGAEETSREILTDYIKQLSSIQPEKLDDSRQYTYALLKRYLDHSLAGNAFSYYEEPLSPSSGMQSQLPILFAEYAFRTEKDVEDYLSLLSQTDAYFSSLLLYEQEKKAAGLSSAAASLQKVCTQCSTILSEKELETGSHFLQTTFSQRLMGLQEAGTITGEQAAQYTAENNRLLQTVLLPAYQKLSEDILLLVEEDTSLPTGLSCLPKGREYYAWLVERNTGCGMSVEALKALLYPHFDSVYKAFRNLLFSREDAVGIWLQSVRENTFPLHTPEEMLSDLQTRMASDFPAFPSLAGTALPSVTVKEVSASLEPYTAPAFYFTPPLDDTENNVIYINKRSTPEGLELYTTLAHEGYPGHLYQSVYSQLTARQYEADNIRQILWYGGYQEGWAVYVEFLAYDYAADMMEALGREDAAFAYDLEKHNRDMQLCLYALLDIAIHYDGAEYEQVHKVLSTFGVTDPDTTRRVYDYIAEEPANYLKYYVGYLEILQLKELARTQWGDDYSDLKFHTFFLQQRPSDFTTLSEALKNTLP